MHLFGQQQQKGEPQRTLRLPSRLACLHKSGGLVVYSQPCRMGLKSAFTRPASLVEVKSLWQRSISQRRSAVCCAAQEAIATLSITLGMHIDS
jgi:hypothetical protein